MTGLGVRCAFGGCTIEAVEQCNTCRFGFCRRHIHNHNHGGTKGRGAGIS